MNNESTREEIGNLHSHHEIHEGNCVTCQNMDAENERLRVVYQKAKELYEDWNKWRQTPVGFIPRDIEFTEDSLGAALRDYEALRSEGEEVK